MSEPARRPTPVHWTAHRAARGVTAASVSAVVAVAAAGTAVPAGARPALLIVAAVLGLPHGAADSLPLQWQGGRRARVLAVSSYALLAVAVVAVSVAAPIPAVLALLVVSVGHFAEGEMAYDRLRGGTGPLAPALAIGSSVVILPVLLRPQQSAPLLAALDPRLPHALAAVRAPALALGAVLIVTGLVAARRSPRLAAEVTVVAAACLLAPAVLAFGTWFAAWHAPRHLLRLAAAVPTGDGRQRAGRVARGALLPSVAAAAGILALLAVRGTLGGSVLTALLALTVPHAAVVHRLDAWAQRTRPPTAAAGGRRPARAWSAPVV